MRYLISALSLLAVVALIGCSGVSEPQAVSVQDLDFSGYETMIHSEDHHDDAVFVVTYNSDMIVTGVWALDDPALMDKDGDDDTRIRVTWGELKRLYSS